MVAADFNGDGRMDVAMAQGNQHGAIVFYSKSDGSLEPAVFYPLITANGAIPLQRSPFAA